MSRFLESLKIKNVLNCSNFRNQVVPKINFFTNKKLEAEPRGISEIEQELHKLTQTKICEISEISGKKQIEAELRGIKPKEIKPK